VTLICGRCGFVMPFIYVLSSWARLLLCSIEVLPPGARRTERAAAS
jgi:hypothetical protein